MRRLAILEKTDSTNNYLHAHREFHRAFTSVLALEQTAGRGRLERKWYSGYPGENLSCSFVLPAPRAASAMVPLVAAMALHSWLSRFVTVKIKWPNDIVHEGKKLAGILCEGLATNDALAIVGIGVNIATRHFPQALGANATSLALAGAPRLSIQSHWLGLYRTLVRQFRGVGYPLSREFIARYNALAYRYALRGEISELPLQFETLLTDGRAVFNDSSGRKIVLDMPA